MDVSAYQKMRNAIKQQQAKLGLVFTDSKVVAKDRDGKPIIGKDGKPVMHTVSTLSHISDDARELIEVFNFNEPCWFKGCDGLRKQYKEELANSSCKTCKGALLRKYNQLARQLLDADPDRIPPAARKLSPTITVKQQ